MGAKAKPRRTAGSLARTSTLLVAIGSLALACDSGGGTAAAPPRDSPPAAAPIDTSRTPPAARAVTHVDAGRVAARPADAATAETQPAARDASVPPEREPRLLVSRLRPSSAVTPGQLAQSVLRNRPRLLACFTAALARDPGLHGDVDVRVRTEHTGHTRSLSVGSPNLADEELLGCIRQSLAAHRYPAAMDAGTGRVSYRITFEVGP